MITLILQENYEDKQDLQIPEIDVKQSVYVSKCRNCTITVPAKCKNISIGQLCWLVVC